MVRSLYVVVTSMLDNPSRLPICSGQTTLSLVTSLIECKRPVLESYLHKSHAHCADLFVLIININTYSQCGIPVFGLYIFMEYVLVVWVAIFLLRRQKMWRPLDRVLTSCHNARQGFHRHLLMSSVIVPALCHRGVVRVCRGV